MQTKKILLLLVLIVIVIGIFLLLRKEGPTKNDISITEDFSFESITSDECIKKEGEIVNKLNSERSYTSDDVLGEVEDARCPCICIKKKSANNSSDFLISE